MKRVVFLAVVTATSMFVSAQTRYVTETGAGNKTGLSWATASNDLQKMINQSNPGDSVFVEEGTYAPIYPSNKLSFDSKDNAFVLRWNVLVFGGFSTVKGDTAFADRNWKDNETILDGWLGNSTYSNHVVISSGDVGILGCLDGFTILSGGPYFTGTPGTPSKYITVNGNPIYSDWGAGITLYNSSPLLANLVVKENFAV